MKRLYLYECLVFGWLAANVNKSSKSKEIHKKNRKKMKSWMHLMAMKKKILCGFYFIITANILFVCLCLFDRLPATQPFTTLRCTLYTITLICCLLRRITLQCDLSTIVLAFQSYAKQNLRGFSENQFKRILLFGYFYCPVLVGIGFIKFNWHFFNLFFIFSNTSLQAIFNFSWR